MNIVYLVKGNKGCWVEATLDRYNNSADWNRKIEYHVDPVEQMQLKEDAAGARYYKEGNESHLKNFNEIAKVLNCIPEMEYILKAIKDLYQEGIRVGYEQKTNEDEFWRNR